MRGAIHAASHRRIGIAAAASPATRGTARLWLVDRYARKGSFDRRPVAVRSNWWRPLQAVQAERARLRPIPELVQGNWKSRTSRKRMWRAHPGGNYGSAEESHGVSNRRGNNEPSRSFSQKDEHSSPGREEKDRSGTYTSECWP